MPLPAESGADQALFIGLDTEIKNQLDCPTCERPSIQPRTLVCRHTLCTQCLKQSVVRLNAAGETVSVQNLNKVDPKRESKCIDERDVSSDTKTNVEIDCCLDIINIIKDAERSTSIDADTNAHNGNFGCTRDSNFDSTTVRKVGMDKFIAVVAKSKEQDHFSSDEDCINDIENAHDLKKDTLKTASASTSAPSASPTSSPPCSSAMSTSTITPTPTVTSLLTPDTCKSTEKYIHIIVCPICGTPTNVPNGDVTSLPINSLIEMSQNSIYSDGSSIEISGSIEEQAGETLSPKKADMNGVTSIPEYISETVYQEREGRLQLSPPTSRKQLVCKLHSKLKDQYCNTCGLMLCATCVAESHTTGDHSISRPSEVDQVHRNELRKMIESTKMNAQPPMDSLLGTAELMTHVVSSTEQLKTMAEDIFDRLIVTLRERKRQFAENLDLELDARLEILEQHYRTVSSITSSVESRLLMAKQLADCPSPEVFLDGKKEMVNVLRDTCKSLTKRVVQPPCQGTMFLEFDTIGLAMSIGKVGGVTHHRDHHSIGSMITEVGSFGTELDDLKYPLGITIDCRGRLVVCDRDNKCVKLFTICNGIVVNAEMVGFGRIKSPQSAFVDNKGTVYVSDSELHTVQMYRGDMLVRELGGVGKEEGLFQRPAGVCVHTDGRIFVADSGNRRVQVFSGEGRYLYAISHENHQIPLFSARLHGPRGLLIYENKLFVTDRPSKKVWVFRLDGHFLYSFGDSGNNNELLNTPDGITLLPGSCIVAIVDTGRHRISLFSLRGAFVGSWGERGAGDGEFILPTGICVDPFGTVWVSDTSNHRIQSF
eukprot:CFRG0224T1